MEPQGFPQPYKQPNLPPSLRFPKRHEIDWIKTPPRMPLKQKQQEELARILAASAHVQSTKGTITAATNTTIAFGSNITANSCLIVGILISGSTVGVAATNPIVDTLGNLYTIPVNAANAGNCRVVFAYANNSTGGANSVTVTLAGTGTADVFILEYSGVGSIAGNRTLADVANSAATSGTSFSSSSTPQQSGSLHMLLLGTATTGLTMTSSSHTLRQTSSTNTSAGIGEVVTSTTSVAASTEAMAWGGSSIQYGAARIILRPAGQQAIRRLASAGIASAATLTSASYTPQLGSVLLAFVQTVTTGRVTNSVADSVSESWSLVAGSRAVNASGGELSAWICNGTVSATARTFSATPDAATAGNITIIELLGVVSCTGIADQVATSTSNGTAISVTAGSATAIAGELAILAVGASNTTTSTQPGGSDALIADTSSANGSMGITTRLLNTVSTPTLTATLGTTRQYSAILITLKTGGVSFIQSVAVSGTSATSSTTATLPFNSAPTNALISNQTVGSSRTLTGITDGSNTYASAIAQINGTIETSEWYAKNIAGGKVAAAFARSGNGAVGGVLREFSGLDTVNLLDTTGSTTGSTTTATPTSGVPLAGYVLSIITAGDSGTGNAWSPSSPFVSVQAPTTTNINNGGGVSTTFTTTPAAISGSLTSAATTPAYATAIAVFRIAGSPLYGLTRTITMSAALQATVSRTVPQAAALSILAQTRDIPQSAGLQTTVGRQVPQSAAFQATLSRQIPESAALSVAALSRTVAQTAGFTILNRARQINQYAELSQVVTYLHRSGVLLEWGSEYEVMLATSDVPVGASGGTSRLTVEIRDHSTYRDPSTVMLLIDAPDGTRTQLTYGVDAALHRMAQGVYYSDLTRSQTGIYTVTWSDGTPQGWASDVVVST